MRAGATWGNLNVWLYSLVRFMLPTVVIGDTTSIAPHLVRSSKPSGVGLAWYYGGGARGSPGGAPLCFLRVLYTQKYIALLYKYAYPIAERKVERLLWQRGWIIGRHDPALAHGTQQRLEAYDNLPETEGNFPGMLIVMPGPQCGRVKGRLR